MAGGGLDGLDLVGNIAFVGMVIVNFKIAIGVEGDGVVSGHFTSAPQGGGAATFGCLRASGRV